MNRVLPGLLTLSATAVLMTPYVWGAPAGDTSEPCRQIAVLRNGYTMEFGRIEIAGQAAKLYLCGNAGSGYVEFQSDQIERFEQPERIPPPTASVPVASTAVTVADRDTVRKLISSAAARHQIDPDFLASVVKAESAFNPTAVSIKGASGLMQLMPQTAAEMGVQNVFDPAANVEGGTKYLQQLLQRYDWDAVKALAAYNAGPQRVDQYGGIPPYAETRDYVSRVVADYNRKKLEQQAHPTAPPPATEVNK
ncbi:MAG: lytic transglycosylase domain-containing protein [Bryobacteraceae bacterium]